MIFWCWVEPPVNGWVYVAGRGKRGVAVGGGFLVLADMDPDGRAVELEPLAEVQTRLSELCHLSWPVDHHLYLAWHGDGEEARLYIVFLREDEGRLNLGEPYSPTWAADYLPHLKGKAPPTDAYEMLLG